MGSFEAKLAQLSRREGRDQEAYRRRLRELVEVHCRDLVAAIAAQGRLFYLSVDFCTLGAKLVALSDH
jgi:DnaJ-domain-containing protein 1